jgi:hypothetical protein
MKNVMLTAMGLLLAAACNKAAPEPNDTDLSRASAAIRALAERDGQAVAQCDHAVDACNERLADAAADTVCGKLAERCEALQTRLAEVRSPAIGCWRAVEACEQNAPEQAQCSRDVSTCEAIEQDVDVERDGAVACQARVEACLTRSATLPEAALVACENIAAACERAAAREDAGAAAPIEPPPVDSEDEDDGPSNEDGDDGDGDGDDADGVDRPQRPDVPRGRGRGEPADAGAESAD